MIVTRWQASTVPSKQQILDVLTGEGLDPFVEDYSANTKITDHRHPYSEVRLVFSGEILFNISGNQLVLRAGDRIEIPPNTKHSHTVAGNGPCTCICAFKI